MIYFSIGISASLIIIAFLVGRNRPKHFLFDDLIYVGLVFVIAWLATLFVEPLLNTTIFFLDKTGKEYIISTAYEIQLFKDLLTSYPEMEEVIIKYVIIFSKIFAFTFMFVTGYITAYIVRLFENKKIKKANKEIKSKKKNYLGSLFLVVEMALVIVITLTPFSFSYNFYNLANEQLILDYDEDKNICQEFDLIDEKYCKLLETIGEDKFISLFGNSLPQKAVIKISTFEHDEDLKEIENDFATIKDLLHTLHDNNALQIILDPNFSFKNISSHDINFLQLSNDLESVFGESELFNFVGNKVYNDAMVHLHNFLSQLYPNIDLSKMLLSEDKFLEQFPKILNLMDFALNYDLMTLLHDIGGKVTFQNLKSILNHFINNNMLKFGPMKKQLDSLTSLTIIQEVIQHIKTNFIESLVELVAAPVIGIMHTGLIILDALDEFMIEFKQLPIFEFIHNYATNFVNLQNN